METDDRTRKEKKFLRDKFIKIRESMTDEMVKEKSQIIVKKLLSFDKFVQAKNVMLYYPFRNEVDVKDLLNICKDKSFYFPVVDFENKTLKIRKYTGKFYKNKFGILEPIYENNDFGCEILDFIIVPGIVFDTRCYRIGYGGGYYDKLLSVVRCTTCGVCYDEQIVDRIPVTVNDVPLNYVISDKRTFCHE